MPSYDFEVDLEALINAAKGCADTIQLFKDKDAEDFIPSEDACGDDAVWDAVDEFQERWDDGMNNLTEDVQEIAGRLGKIATTYAEFDANGSKALKALVGGIGHIRIGG